MSKNTKKNTVESKNTNNTEEKGKVMDKIKETSTKVKETTLKGVEGAGYGLGVAAGAVAKPAKEFGGSFKKGFLAGFNKAYNN